jgi:hypothetical protein
LLPDACSYVIVAPWSCASAGETLHNGSTLWAAVDTRQMFVITIDAESTSP